MRLMTCRAGTPRPDSSRDGNALMSDNVEDMMHIDQHDSHVKPSDILRSRVLKGLRMAATEFLAATRVSSAAVRQHETASRGRVTVNAGTGFLRVDAISISGITESLGPWDLSSHAIFRAINQVASARSCLVVFTFCCRKPMLSCIPCVQGASDRSIGPRFLTC